MSYSFKQFLSTLSGNNSGVADTSTNINNDSEQDEGINNVDISGGFSPIVLSSPLNASDSLSMSTSNSREDSPGSSSTCDISSTNAPLVFSKAEEFISATLSSVKIGSGAGVFLSPQNSNEHPDNKSINVKTKSDSIKVDELCTQIVPSHSDGILGKNENELKNNMDNSDLLAKQSTDNCKETKQLEGATSNLELEDEGDKVDSKSALNMPYVGNSSGVPNDSKTWREGMAKQTGESSKTMFISQNLSQKYDKADAQIKGVTYKACASKITREVHYFQKIINVIGADLRNTEYVMSPSDVLTMRQGMKEKIATLKDCLDKFVAESLEGEVRDKPPARPEPVETVQVEYIHPPEKKSAKEAKAELCLENVDVANSLHKCVDCGHYVNVGAGESLEAALEKHSYSPRHKASCDNGEQSADKKSILQKQLQKEKKEEANRKALENVQRQNVLNHNQSRQMMLNQITSETVNGQVMLTCNPCGDVIPVDAFTNHVTTNQHKDNLNNFNIRLQKDLIVKYPDLFGPGKMFHLTDVHIVSNKIFVDPQAKYSYCGLCRKELPSKQANIDEHITSKNHERLMEGKAPNKQKDAEQIPNVKNKTGMTKSNVEGVTSEGFDTLSIVKQRARQDRRSSGSIQSFLETEETDEAFGTTSSDGKFVCLLCDARGITSLQNLISHFNGGPHKTNLDHSKQPRAGLDPAIQMLFIKNMISITFGRFPLIFECFACNAMPFAGLQSATDHINSPNHLSALALKQQQLQKTLHVKQERNESRRSSVITSVILHRNGINFWCLSCRCELQDVTSAYRHVLLPGHLTVSVDGVSIRQGTQFYCEYCNVLISGEKNVGQHITSPKHRQQVATGKTGINQETSAPPAFSRAQAKKMDDDRNGNKPSSATQATDDGKLKLEERMLLHKNCVSILKKNLFKCVICDSEKMTKFKILSHIFTYEHILKMQLQTQPLPITN